VNPRVSTFRLEEGKTIATNPELYEGGIRKASMLDLGRQGGEGRKKITCWCLCSKILRKNQEHGV